MDGVQGGARITIFAAANGWVVVGSGMPLIAKTPKELGKAVQRMAENMANMGGCAGEKVSTATGTQEA